jgi:hypothetical protein
VADQVDHLERGATHFDRVAVVHGAVDLHRQLVGVVRARDGLGVGGLDHLAQRPVVVPVPMGGDHPGEPVRADRGEDPVRLVGGVDEQLLVGVPAPQHVDVVGHLAHGELGDHQVGQLADVTRPARLHLPAVAHRSPPPRDLGQLS